MVQQSTVNNTSSELVISMATYSRVQWATRFNVPQDVFDITIYSVRHEIRGDMIYMRPKTTKMLRFRLGKLRRGKRVEPYQPLAPNTRQKDPLGHRA
jgi:hypothetical protein